MSDSVNQLINDKAVCRIAPATPGLLKRPNSIWRNCKYLVCNGLSVNRLKVTKIHLSISRPGLGLIVFYTRIQCSDQKYTARLVVN